MKCEKSIQLRRRRRWRGDSAPPWAALHNFARFFCGMHGMVRAARVWQTSIKLKIDFPGIRQLQNCIAVGWRI